MKGDQKKVFARGEQKQKSKSVQKDNKFIDTEQPVLISEETSDSKYNNLFCSDAQILVNAIEKMDKS